MVAVEDDGDGPVHLVQLVQEIESGLIGVIQTFRVGLDVLVFGVRQILRRVRILELVIRIEIRIRKVVLHGNGLIELVLIR